MVNALIDSLGIRKAKLHLLRMDIDINLRRIDLYMQYGKRIPVLHHIRLVCVLDRLLNHIGLDVTSIDKVVHIGAVSAGYGRLSNKSGQTAADLTGRYLHQIGRDLPSIDRIDHIFQIAIA